MPARIFATEEIIEYYKRNGGNAKETVKNLGASNSTVHRGLAEAKKIFSFNAETNELWGTAFCIGAVVTDDLERSESETIVQEVKRQ